MKYLKKIVLSVSTIIIMIVAGNNHAVEIQRYPPLLKLVDMMIKYDGYPHAELKEILLRANIDQNIIDSMDRQYKVKPWQQYRQLFITEKSIQNGIAYWNKHAEALEHAAQTYGVPPAIIVALIGVETRYGTYLGKKSVLDALVTLTAEYPRRSSYFGKELRAFLNIMRSENIDPSTILGSYAGAVGIPQFMPTSYKQYAVDFSKNGSLNLINEHEDAIGSVANYLKQKGWVAGQDIQRQLPNSIPHAAVKLVSKGAKPTLTAAVLKQSGIEFDESGGSTKMALLRLKEASEPQYLIGFNNFYVITRYNNSINYAMVVTELSYIFDQRRK